MKTINHLTLGMLSSFLLSFGLARLAQLLDPLSRRFGALGADDGIPGGPSVPCPSPYRP
jgi:hypothetical protein